ncbi:nucleotidyltransferase domain-containing protein [Patescibacteria group bacterium]|nr:nucleotidyltransferase domain-containing protein [Patescibacteria group bacterium]
MDKNSFINSKRTKLLHRVRFFDLVPFVDIVFITGSVALGTAHKDSDFDVLVCAKKNRIFTVRFFCFILFSLLGWIRNNENCAQKARDKFCFNHFVTSEKYQLSPPYNDYWKKLYLCLIPVYGSEELIQKFYNANAEWVGEKRIYEKINDISLYKKRRIVKIFLKKMLNGKIGNFVEKILKKIQISKIKKSLKTENLYKPRIIYNDSELEFHPHTKRIEEYIQN